MLLVSSSRTRRKVLQRNTWFTLAFIGGLTFFLCAIFADFLPLGFAPGYMDLENIYQPPFYWENYTAGKAFHWLGTDQLGRDVLANLVYGCRTALLVSFPAMLLASFLGVFLGGVAGYFGDRSLSSSLFSFPIMIFFLFLAFFYGFYVRHFAVSEALRGGGASAWWEIIISLLIFLVVSGIGYWVNYWIEKLFRPTSRITLPVDQLVLRLIELLSAIPRLVLILCLAAYVKPAITSLVIITGLTFWTEPARLIRAELLRIKATNYIESARALGLQDFYILFRHALPNAFSSVIVAFTFGIVSLISLEATLSFLNIGVPPDIPSWGKLTVGAKSNLAAWWLVIFPGLVLAITVLSLHTCSNYLIKKLDPRQR